MEKTGVGKLWTFVHCRCSSRGRKHGRRKRSRSHQIKLALEVMLRNMNFIFWTVETRSRVKSFFGVGSSISNTNHGRSLLTRPCNKSYKVLYQATYTDYLTLSILWGRYCCCSHFKASKLNFRDVKTSKVLGLLCVRGEMQLRGQVHARIHDIPWLILIIQGFMILVLFLTQLYRISCLFLLHLI